MRWGEHNRTRSVCKECGGASTTAQEACARNAVGRASPSTAAKEGRASSAAGRASASTTAEGARVTIAFRRRTSAEMVDDGQPGGHGVCVCVCSEAVEGGREGCQSLLATALGAQA
jgi:hypothetical protein